MSTGEVDREHLVYSEKSSKNTKKNKSGVCSLVLVSQVLERENVRMCSSGPSSQAIK